MFNNHKRTLYRNKSDFNSFAFPLFSSIDKIILINTQPSENTLTHTHTLSTYTSAIKPFSFAALKGRQHSSVKLIVIENKCGFNIYMNAFVFCVMRPIYQRWTETYMIRLTLSWKHVPGIERILLVPMRKLCTLCVFVSSSSSSSSSSAYIADKSNWL